MTKRIFNSVSGFRFSGAFLSLLAVGMLAISCSSDDDGFEDANPDAAKKYVTKITATGEDEIHIGRVEYDSQGRVIMATDGEDSRYFLYDENGNLERVTGDGDNLLMGEIMSEIHAAYEIGEVLEFDSKGNPTVLELYDEDYYYNQITYNAVITYDDKPFTFYHTLKAAGIIDVLYDVRLQFMAPPEIVMAKKLLPVNNPVKAKIVNDDNDLVQNIKVDYNYGSDKYPVSSTVLTEEDGYTSFYNVSYEYK